MKLSVNTHLSKEDIIKNGSIFTPDYIVELVVKQIKNKLSDNTTIIDFGAGYGAFSSAFLNLPHKRIIATDCDEQSINFIKQEHSGVDTILENSLLGIDKSKYADNDEIIVVGNPPYNDVTSQYKKGEKGSFEMDEDVYARDLGISFLKMYDKIGARYICVLHPLSYLCKKNNFSSLGVFNYHYKLVSGILFSSKHFESIKKTNAEFPVVAALYERNGGMTFDYILNFKFDVFGSDKKYVIGAFNTIDGVVDKYPTKIKNDEDLQFYTLRDINALHRNRTFLTGFCANGIKMTKEKLHYYAWLDLFKNNFDAGEFGYLFGNLSPLLTDKINDLSFQDKLLAYILNENEVVKTYYETNDKDFYEKFAHVQYSKKELIDECLKLSIF